MDRYSVVRERVSVAPLCSTQDGVGGRSVGDGQGEGKMTDGEGVGGDAVAVAVEVGKEEEQAVSVHPSSTVKILALVFPAPLLRCRSVLIGGIILDCAQG